VVIYSRLFHALTRRLIEIKKTSCSGKVKLATDIQYILNRKRFLTLVTFEKFKTTIYDSPVTASVSRPKGGPELAWPPFLDPLLVVALLQHADEPISSE